MPRALMLALSTVCIFVVVAAIMLRLMPAPLKDSDYLVIGSVATLVALFVAFVMLISTSKSSEVFFKKRRKPGPKD